MVEQSIKLSVKDLSLSYGNKPILQQINCDFHEQSVYAILGPSGSGKSNFLRCLNRMNDYEDNLHISGKILLDGENIYDKNYDIVRLRSKVGMVFQKPNPFYGSIYRNITYGPKLLNMSKSEIEHNVEISLKDAGLWDEVKDRLYDNAYSLSGGQQQRLCIARAIAISPNILLMDEPCSALDPVGKKIIEKLIVKLKQKYIIIVITHSIKQALNISDYIMFFYQGNLIEHNNTLEFFSKSKNHIIRDFYQSYVQ